MTEAQQLKAQGAELAELRAAFATPPAPHEQAMLDSLAAVMARQRTLVDGLAERVRDETASLRQDTTLLNQSTAALRAAR